MADSNRFSGIFEKELSELDMHIQSIVSNMRSGEPKYGGEAITLVDDMPLKNQLMFQQYLNCIRNYGKRNSDDLAALNKILAKHNKKQFATATEVYEAFK